MKLYLFLFTLVLCSCGSKMHYNYNDISKTSEDSTYLNTSDYEDKTIHLSENISNLPKCIQLVVRDGVEKLLLLDRTVLYQFDWETGVLEDSLSLESCGRLAGYSGFKYCAEDSIFVLNFGDNSNTTLCLVNKSGAIQKKWQVGQLKDASKVSLVFGALYSNRLHNNGRYVILPGLSDGIFSMDIYDTLRSAMLVSLQENDSVSYLKYPQCYYETSWGGNEMNYASCCTDNDGSVLFSYPAEHRIFKYDAALQSCDTVYMSSRYTQSIKEFDCNMFSQKNETTKRFLMCNSYYSILFDPYRNIYYRIACHPDVESCGTKFLTKPFSIIFMDRAYRVFSESCVLSNKEYNFNEILCCKQGVAVRKFSENENEITFRCFLLK